MRKLKYLLLSALVIAVVSLFSAKDAGANGGTPFNINIQFVTWSPATCTTSMGTNFPCTKYDYKYNVTSGNAFGVSVDVLIPKDVMTKFTSSSADAAAAGCKFLITNGAGDQSLDFAENIFTHNVCRVTNIASALTNGIPSSLNNGAMGTFSLYADPSDPDDSSWVKSPNKTAFVLSGPSVAQAQVTQTSATLTSGNKTITYLISGGTISAPGANVVPLNNTKLCLPAMGQSESFVGSDGISYHCETISFVTDQADVKTTGGDPCRFVGGSAICY